MVSVRNSVFCVFLMVGLTPVGGVSAAQLQLRLLETTDLHMHVMNFDYYRNAEVDDVGLARTATLIAEAREEVVNSLLFDNGDLIQGNPMGDYLARARGLAFGETHPMIQVMNDLGYDAANIGNHEFNYGLDFLLKTLAGATFPYVVANVFEDDGDDDPANDRHYFQPYVILERSLTDTDGQVHDVSIGVIGFTPPQIMRWDKSHLEGRVTVTDIVATAERLVPQMREQGADVIVAIPHSGLASSTPQGFDENATAYLSHVPGIDAILFGHAHTVFPSEVYEDFPGADIAAGTLNGVPSVMPGFWGGYLGVVDLTLEQTDGRWEVVDGGGSVRPIFAREGRETSPLVASDPDVVSSIQATHDATLEWIGQPVGTITAPINSFFALVQDDPSIQIVNNAQRWYGEQLIQGTEYEGLPVLAAGAPFKSGGRGGPDYFTDLPAGEIAIRNVADLYIYPNTVQLVKLNGAQIKQWLERAAVQFNTIDVGSTEPQALINESHPSYNFDVIDGVSYRIDVTGPARYDRDGALVNEQAERVIDLQYEGEPVDPAQEFVVVTNNYRASGGGTFPDLDGSTIIIEAPRTNRQVLVDYILDAGELDPAADGNWQFAPVDGDVNVEFDTSPNGADMAAAAGLETQGTQASGFARYRLPLGSAQ